MRVAENKDPFLGQVAIDDVDLNPKSRDDIPAVLQGVQYIHRDPDLLEEILNLLSSHLFKDRSSDGSGGETAEDEKKINPHVGRPGMSLWCILVLAILKQGLNCDYDRLHELACKHLDVRRMMGLCELCFGKPEFSYRTVLRNVSLVTGELLGEINQVVVRAGHQLIGREPGEALQGRCDSFVVETDVEYPTDTRLLWDSLRWLIVIMGMAFDEFGLAGWRQHKKLLEKGCRLFGRVRMAKQYKKNPNHVKRYLAFANEMAERVPGSLEALAGEGVPESRIQEAKELTALVQKLVDQIERRILQGEVIPPSEKTYSVFVPFTRWCSKGKAGKPVELGVPVCVVEDEHQFVLSHRIMWTESDVDLIPEIIGDTQEQYPELQGCSFDKGFWSPRGKVALDKVMEMPVLPKKGRLSKADKERESTGEFREARRKHPAVESAINNLEQRGLERIREKSKEGFARMVALSILASNVHRIGVIVRDRQREQLKKKRLRRVA